MFFNWMVTTMCYYGLTSAAATLTPDLYLNFTLAILVEVSPTALLKHLQPHFFYILNRPHCSQF